MPETCSHWKLFVRRRGVGNLLRQDAFNLAFKIFLSGDRAYDQETALMSTTARLEHPKPDRARRELRRAGPRRDSRAAEDDRGREAGHPAEIPSRGWLAVLWRAWGEVGEANLFLVAGGVPCALILALFPGL